MHNTMADYKRNRASLVAPVKIKVEKRNGPLKSPSGSLLSMGGSSLLSSSVNSVGSMGMGSNRTMSIPRPLKPMNTGSGAGSGAPNFSGKWQLDREHSDSTNDYLEAMGLPLIARQAADKLDLTVVIQQNNSDFIITRKTRIFTDTKPLKFGEECTIKNCQIKVTGTPQCVLTESQLPAYKGVLLDTRTMDEERRRMFVKLELQLPDREPVITNRVFNKVSDSTSLDFDDEILMDEPSDSKRKR